MSETTTKTMTHDLVDVIDLQPMPGEYAGCKHPMEPHDIFGTTVQAWHRYHAARIAVGKLFEGRCECCGQHLRYAHVTVDEQGRHHCFGYNCLAVESFGQEGARRLEYSRKIEQKKTGFCATFSVPDKFWDLPREQRPTFARPWKGKAMGRSKSRGVTWKLSVWGDSMEECLDNCISLDALLGVKLS